MKERPIIFNTEMVQAIMAGKKTVTRRPIKNQPEFNFNQRIGLDYFRSIDTGGVWFNREEFTKRECKIAQTGDLLYVRETWAYYRGFAEETKKGAPVIYRADEDECGQFPCLLDGRKTYVNQRNDWKPSIHMPKKYSRIWLDVTDVRVERVQEITEEGAEDEGFCDRIETPIEDYRFARSLFTETWESIYGNWIENPWVWVIEFERAEQ